MAHLQKKCWVVIKVITKSTHHTYTADVSPKQVVAVATAWPLSWKTMTLTVPSWCQHATSAKDPAKRSNMEYQRPWPGVAVAAQHDGKVVSTWCWIVEVCREDAFLMFMYYSKNSFKLWYRLQPTCTLLRLAILLSKKGWPLSLTVHLWKVEKWPRSTPSSLQAGSCLATSRMPCHEVRVGLQKDDVGTSVQFQNLNQEHARYRKASLSENCQCELPNVGDEAAHEKRTRPQASLVVTVGDES